jgi:UDP-N-acetylglucosamine--N-acetylmuramyl-(pentapeptide) pyrophosphoryl-undecaprenol N-acetylglucosamine transferase
MSVCNQIPSIAIACGGTGGHTFPGIAIARCLLDSGYRVVLIISSKQVDQQAVKDIKDMDIVTLPAISGRYGRLCGSGLALVAAMRKTKHIFREFSPCAVLAMGGFCGVAPILVGKMSRTRTFLHEANSVPGKANRYLARLVDRIFVGFPQVSDVLKKFRIVVTGTPVRREFFGLDKIACRTKLGLRVDAPVWLVMGGSQGASALNHIALQTAPALNTALPTIQILHITGTTDIAEVESAYKRQRIQAVVKAFKPDIHLALGAADCLLSRAGASSMAEIAAVGIPSILVPFPYATDNHQFFNAKAYSQSGAALQIDQNDLTPDLLASQVCMLIEQRSRRTSIINALEKWSKPNAAHDICRRIIACIKKKEVVAPQDNTAVQDAKELVYEEDRL